MARPSCCLITHSSALVSGDDRDREIRPDVDLEIIADLLGGLVVIRRLLTGRHVTVRFVREVVDMVLDGAGCDSGG